MECQSEARGHGSTYFSNKPHRKLSKVNCWIARTSCIGAMLQLGVTPFLRSSDKDCGNLNKNRPSGQVLRSVGAHSKRNLSHRQSTRSVFRNATDLRRSSFRIVLIGLFVFDEMGLAYKFFIVHNRDRRFGLRMIPYPLLYASLIMLCAF
jgi:hypothetical protein